MNCPDQTDFSLPVCDNESLAIKAGSHLIID